MISSQAKRNYWGWGNAGEGLDTDQKDNLKMMMGMRLGVTEFADLQPRPVEALTLPKPRFEAPPELAGIVSQSISDRAGHTYGKAFRDVVRALAGDFTNAPDAVAYPRNEEDIAALLAWCGARNVAAIPYGGGSSVVGGIEARLGGKFNGAISIDMSGLARILEVDSMSRAARIQAGIYGPALEEALRPSGFTLRHFPQSFEFSTLGGWIATRAGGHFATLYTHIDDFVESLRVVTPAGNLESRRLPGSGAGPSPDRMFIGSEGSLGIVTEAWMRLQARPVYRAAVTVKFDDFYAAAGCARLLAQSGLYPSNCRLIDAQEALNSGAGDGSSSLLLVAFESADHPLDAWMARALEICRSCGGKFNPESAKTKSDGDGEREGAAGAWRSMFLKAPYLRDALTTLGLVVDTFETAVTWNQFEAFHAAVIEAAEKTMQRICGGGVITCRFTHAYPDGAAPYYTIIAPGKPGSQMQQWDEIKAAVSEALITHGGTITHHHAVGRDHRPWYDRQRPDLFAKALTGAKAVLDPKGIMNPGVIVG